jgi:hypothetical protein
MVRSDKIKLRHDAQLTELSGGADSLLRYLASCGYSIGVDHHIRAHHLLASLAAVNRLPDTQQELETWIRPVVCQSREEQDHFRSDFEQWLRSRPIRASKVPRPGDRVGKELRQIRGRDRRDICRASLAAVSASYRITT